MLTAAAAAALSAKKESFGRGGSSRRVNRDLGRLLPGFRERLERVLGAMSRAGWQPLVWEGYRSPERAAQLAKGPHRAIALSMHTLGAAADVVNGANPANPWQAPDAFWADLGRLAEQEGLTWGGQWSPPDRPHVQAVTVAQQAAFRRMSADERARFVA